MHRIVINVVLLTGLFYSSSLLVSGIIDCRMPGNEQGYAPVQPIDYSHRVHAGELGLDCRFCHTAADHSRHAGIPSTDICMKCHKYVTSSFDVMQQERTLALEEKREPQQIVSDDLQKLYDSLALSDPKAVIPENEANSIAWVRVHNLPDYVYFDHRAHLAVGITCQKCHGPVETMERVRQFETLSMGWCVNCHREANKSGIDGRAVHASTTCSVCHH